MKIKRFSPLPDFLLERLVPFHTSFNGKSWEDLYTAVNYLKEHYPDKVFKSEPYIYLELENQHNGFIFIESSSDELFYVYK